MMVAIAFESIVKLFSFIVIGFFVVYVLFNGWGDLMTKAQSLPNYVAMTTIGGEHTYFHLFLLMKLVPNYFPVSEARRNAPVGSTPATISSTPG